MERELVNENVEPSARIKVKNMTIMQVNKVSVNLADGAREIKLS
jgi:hypothetical protein